MAGKRELFLKHVAQTSNLSMMLEVSHAEGMYITDVRGKKYLDFNSGISVSSLGHRNPDVVTAIKKQTDLYMHTMVYGEHIQAPQVYYAQLLTSVIDSSLNSIYFLNSGSEAVELAIKLGRKYTGRHEVMACRNAYHGSTLGAESLRSDLDFTSALAPTIPGIRHIDFNDFGQIEKINEHIAALIIEPVQAESGVNPPAPGYLDALRAKCDETGTLLIFDEIQTGFSRTGSLFAYQKYGVLPDVLLIAKSMGGGMPIGAVVTGRQIMQSIANKPSLAHITTFGGHPVCVAASLAALQYHLNHDIAYGVDKKAEILKKKLKHPIIKEIRNSGLMMAVELTKKKYLKHVVSRAIENGVLVDYFLFNDRSFRLAPPLILEEKHIDEGTTKLIEAMDFALQVYS